MPRLPRGIRKFAYRVLQALPQIYNLRNLKAASFRQAH